MAFPGNSPVAWHAAAAATDDGKVMITITAEVETGWHIYAMELPADEGPLPTEFRFPESDAYKVSIPLTEPEPQEEFDQNFSMTVRHHSGTPQFTMLIERQSDSPFTVNGEVEYMVCNDRTCLPPVVVPITVEVGAIEQVNK